MKRKPLSNLACVMALLMLLGSCTKVPGIGAGNEDTTQAVESTGQDTTDMTESSADDETTATGDESESESESDTDSESESETEEIIDVVFPDAEPPSIAHLLCGESEMLQIEQSMKNVSLSHVRSTGKFTSTGGTLFTTGEAGLTCVNTGWDALGFSVPVSTDTYVAQAAFSVDENDKGGALNAGMVGIYCPSASNLFIDGGLWFIFREGQVTVYIKQACNVTLCAGLPFDASDGIRFRAEGDTEKANIYANDLQIATVEIRNDGITVKDVEGKEVAKADLTYISVDGTGYFRYMSHYANTTLTEMKLMGRTERSYTPGDDVYSFLSGQSYAFVNQVQYLSDIPAAVFGDALYADGEMTAAMFGFDCISGEDTLTLRRDHAELKFFAGKAAVEINGETYDFPTVVRSGGRILLPVSYFSDMLGYSGQNADNLTVIADGKNVSKESMNMARDRFELYNEVVYNYDDVECNQTGVGKYTPVPFDERLVGIAYTTWHRAETAWGGSSTWDMPLYGSYCSDDEEVIRRHAEQLRDAGVDFVFVDWSNNTEYDPATMRNFRPDFRMIEEATDKLFDIWATIEGAPKICIFVGPGHNGPGTIDSGAHQKKVDQVYTDYVNNPARHDMYFYYDGKPLLMCYGATPNQYSDNPERLWDDDRFTVRWMTGYVGQQRSLFNPRTLKSNKFWSWEERGAQTYTVFHDMVEAVTVTAAQRAQGQEGDAGYIPAVGRQDGATLKKQFQRAIDLGARMVIIVSWNEWTTGEQPSAEVSKDMEPSKIYGTFYLDLMREQIRKFKGQVGN